MADSGGGESAGGGESELTAVIGIGFFEQGADARTASLYPETNGERIGCEV